MEENIIGKKKSHKLIIFILSLTAGLLIGIGGSYYYFNNINNKTEEKEEEKEEKTKEEEKEILNIDGFFVKELIERYDFSKYSTSEIYNMLYKKDINTVSDIIEDNKKVMAYQSMTGNILYFSSDKIQESYKKLFGPEESFIDKDISLGCETLYYDNTTKYYTFKPGTGCGGTSATSLVRKITKAEKTDNNQIEIEVAAALSGYTEDGKEGIINRDGIIEGLDINTFDINKDYEKLDKFKYIFKYDEKNNNYYLLSITKK